MLQKAGQTATIVLVQVVMMIDDVDDDVVVKCPCAADVEAYPYLSRGGGEKIRGDGEKMRGDGEKT